jgi:hypothetical protein
LAQGWGRLAKTNKKSALAEMAGGLILVAAAVIIYRYYPAEVVFPVLVALMGGVSLYFGGKALLSK